MTSARKIIAICGPKFSGKSTLAKLLTKQGFQLQPFAHDLKLMLETFLFSQGLDAFTIDRMIHGDLKEIPTEYFDGQTPRHALQTLGTEWRDLISKNLWVNSWNRRIVAAESRGITKFVVEDLRFLHEAERIHELMGCIIMVHRENPSGSTDLHQSEREYLKISHHLVVVNDMEPTDMLRQVENFFGDRI